MLALALGGRTVDEWQRVMTQSEFSAWVEFYRLFPFDDLHRHHRPAALIAGALGGGDLQQRLDWLQPQPLPVGWTEADINSFRAFGMTPPPRQ